MINAFLFILFMEKIPSAAICNKKEFILSEAFLLQIQFFFINNINTNAYSFIYHSESLVDDFNKGFHLYLFTNFSVASLISVQALFF